ncbi:MAG: polysaccharide pyruvyl transferase CsaB [Fimbriimonadales bacterium]|nr:polysaccharide pyruvyl transferase CsaB [Fimbriimonadales bacterium]
MRIVIAGYYGYRNWGDEGSLATLVQAMRCADSADDPAQKPPVDITVLSADPAFTETTYGVAAIPRMDFRAVRQTIRASDALIFGGGSLLQDATSLRSLLYYLGLIRWGLRAHGRVLLVGQGVGPLHRRLSRWLTGTTLRRVPFLSVRDADSAALLRTLGVTHATVDADLTWAMEAQPPHLELKDGRWIGLAPRFWRDAPVQEAFQALCRQIHAEGFRALLIPMQETQDRPLCEAIAKATEAQVLPEPVHPAQLLGVMRALEGVVAMRLHGAIFAAAQGTPVLCVAYDPKVNALAHQLGAPQTSAARIATELLPAWREFVQKWESLREQVQSSAQSLREAAEELLQRVANALK